MLQNNLNKKGDIMMLIEKIRKIDPFYNGETGKDIDCQNYSEI